jgi:two-component system phosphate regulon sensor histidine kinase PhoR
VPPPQENNRPELFGGLARRLIVAIALVCVVAGLIRIGTGRARLIQAAAESARERLFRFTEVGDDWVAEFDRSGEATLLSAPGAPEGFATQARLASVAAQVDPVEIPLRRWKPEGTFGPMVVIRAARVLTDGEPRTRVAAAPVRGLAPLVERVALETAALVAALAALSVWLVRRARERHRRATRRLATIVSRVSRSERHQDLPAPPFRELERLTRTIDRTLDSLTQRLITFASQRAEAKAILRSMPGAVIALDLEQRVMNTNRVAERVLDLDPDATRGRLLQEMVRQPALLEFARDSVGAPDLRTSEFALRGVTDRIVSASSRPLLSADGELAGVVIVLQDVTRLRKLENLRRDFAANASHELRTPVTNILGYIETLQECHDAAPEERANFIAIIRRNAERLAAIIEDMLELARLEAPDSSGLRGLELTPLGELLEEIAASFAPDLERKGISVKINAEDGVAAEINRGLVSQAVSNLVANAIRYSPPETTITLECRRSATTRGGAQVELAVADQGPGIPEQHLPRLFERFYRVDPARSRELGGTGLGLAIAKHVAMLHRGEIGVTSEPGKGSRFWIRTPQRAATGGPDASGSQP